MNSSSINTKEIQNKFVNQLINSLSIIIPKSILAPIDLIKIRLQCMNSMIKIGTIDVPYKGMLNCERRVVLQEGVRALWKGNGTHILRVLIQQKLNLFFKSYFNRFLLKNHSEDENWKRLVKNFLAGGLAGSMTQIFSYPLQYARTRLTNDLKNSSKERPKQFNGLIDVFKKTLVSDGARGLYRGFVVSCFGVFIYKSIYFGFYDFLKPMIKSSILQQFLGGYFVTLTASLVFHPIDTIRRRMMMSSCSKHVYSSSINCALDMYKNEGITSFFKGNVANIVSGVTGTILVLQGITGAILLIIFDNSNHRISQ